MRPTHVQIEKSSRLREIEDSRSSNQNMAILIDDLLRTRTPNWGQKSKTKQDQVPKLIHESKQHPSFEIKRTRTCNQIKHISGFDLDGWIVDIDHTW